MKNEKKLYADLTEEEKEALYHEQEDRINSLTTENETIIKDSLEQINALKANVASKKDLKAKPGVEKDGEYYEIDFKRVHVLKEGGTVTMTAEELAGDEELCHRLIDLGSYAFRKVVAAE